MVSVSVETAAETEARLRVVMRATSIEWLPGVWQYDEGNTRQGAIAMVVADGQRSWLSPARPTSQTERFRVFRARFEPDADNSGFVGWLATRIKSETGSGVIVVCGYNRHSGGVFDYWGVPEEIEELVRELLDRLGRRSTDGLDGCVMRVIEPASNAQIGPQTVFCFDVRRGVVTARYGGGDVTDGWLMGRLEGPSLEFSYLQLGRDGGVRSGRSRSTLSQEGGSPLEMTEEFQWDGGGSGVNRLRGV